MLVHNPTRAPHRRVRRIPVIQQPDRIRESYFSDLRPLVSQTFRLVETELVPRIPDLLLEAGTRLDAWRFDNWQEALDQVLSRVSKAVVASWPISRLQALVDRVAGQTSSFYKAQFKAQIQAALGVDPFLRDAGLPAAAKAWTTENVRLIRSLPDQALFGDHSDPDHDVPGIRDIVLEGVRAGHRAERIAAEIRERHGVAERRAKLIARDQVGKFYGALNRHRQKESGVDGYVWRTVGDNRVRDNHDALEGKKCSWDDPPMGGGTDETEAGHPGDGINCRCVPEPDLSGYWASL